MTATKIEWTDRVWNPVTGCTKVSQGCKHCYAETIAGRFWAEQYPPNPDGSPRKFTDVRCHPERLGEPLRWRKPSRVFVNSMSDLFHPDVPFEFVEEVWDTMFDTSGLVGTPHHTYQILTKRPARLLEFNKWMNEKRIRQIDYDNVWLGVSVENQAAADERIPLLLQTPAAVRFVSAEPLLGPVHFVGVGYGQGLDWIIAGCESGHGARPADLDWFRSLRDQCQAAGVPFFLKQMMVDGKLTKLPELDGQQWAQYPRQVR